MGDNSVLIELDDMTVRRRHQHEDDDILEELVEELVDCKEDNNDKGFIDLIEFLQNALHGNTLKTRRDFYAGLIEINRSDNNYFWMSVNHPYYKLALQQEWDRNDYISNMFENELVCIPKIFIDPIVDMVYDMWTTNKY